MASPQQSLDQIKLAMAAANELFKTEVIEKRNFAALNDIYTTDARILPPGAPMVSGLEGIKQFWANFVQSANAVTGQLTSVDVLRTGDDIVEIGAAKLTVAPDPQTTADVAVKYVVYWRQENGRWKWDIDIWNLNA